MRPGANAPNEQLLSLVEAEHEALTFVAAEAADAPSPWRETLIAAPEKFRREVNRVLEAHVVALSLHQNSELVPVDSQEMHNAVVAPTLYLLHSQPRFASAEGAYQMALKELRNRDAGDAITDAGTALQDTLIALGCNGTALGPLLTSAKQMGLVRENESPLMDALPNVIRWAARQRNSGEAHRGDADHTMSDAWMVVHVVGALIIRLTEASATMPPSGGV